MGCPGTVKYNGESEYWPFKYQKHLNTELFEIWISNGLVFKWSVYVLCLVVYLCIIFVSMHSIFALHACLQKWYISILLVLCTKLTMQKPDLYIIKHDGSICPVFQWLRCPEFKWPLNTGPFGIQPHFDHVNTKLVWYSDPQCTNDRNQKVGIYMLAIILLSGFGFNWLWWWLLILVALSPLFPCPIDSSRRFKSQFNSDVFYLFWEQQGLTWENNFKLWYTIIMSLIH